MPSNKLTMSPVSLFFLEIVVASAMAGEATAQQLFLDVTNSSFTTKEPFFDTNTTNITSLPTTTFSLDNTGHTSNITTPKYSKNGSFPDLVTNGTSNNNSKVDKNPGNTPSPPPIKTTKTTTTTHKTPQTKPMPAPNSAAGDKTGIIILVVIVLVVVAFGITCFIHRRRERRYSIDPTSRVDEASIPLSSVQPEASPMPQNGLHTFERTETAKEPEEPEVKPETQEEQKAEADNPADPSTEAEAPAPGPGPVPAPDSSEDKPKVDVIEQSSVALLEPNAAEKTDDEGGDSNKTSVESLKETNENNSNNTDSGQKRDVSTLWGVRVDCPV